MPQSDERSRVGWDYDFDAIWRPLLSIYFYYYHVVVVWWLWTTLVPLYMSIKVFEQVLFDNHLVNQYAHRFCIGCQTHSTAFVSLDLWFLLVHLTNAQTERTFSSDIQNWWHLVSISLAQSPPAMCFLNSFESDKGPVTKSGVLR